MEIKSAVFNTSYPSISKCPKDSTFAEFAFIGRSNVGKSSLINMLCNKKELAKVSKSPGKTQLINFFTINEQWYLVDLPGYGYAKVSKSKREEFEKMIQNFITKREQLRCTFVLIDSNIPPQKADMDFLISLGEAEVPFAVVLTKIDRLKPNEKQKNINAIKNEILKIWVELPNIFISSAEKTTGKSDILEFIDFLQKAKK